MHGISLKVSSFFKKKLGKKNAHILKEFNENILDITEDDVIDYESNCTKSMRSVRSEREKINEIEATRKRTQNKFEHLMQNSEARADRMSDANI